MSTSETITSLYKITVIQLPMRIISSTVDRCRAPTTRIPRRHERHYQCIHGQWIQILRDGRYGRPVRCIWSGVSETTAAGGMNAYSGEQMEIEREIPSLGRFLVSIR
jgi:hypothetical protein